MTNDNPTKNETPNEKSRSIEDCTAGFMPKHVSETKVGDLVNIGTREGKSWLCKVIQTTPDSITLKNEYVTLIIDLIHNATYNVYTEEDYGAYVESRPIRLIATDMVEFINHSEDERTQYILTLISLHLNGMNEEQKDKLIEALWEIKSPGSMRLNFGLSKPKYKCVFSER